MKDFTDFVRGRLSAVESDRLFYAPASRVLHEISELWEPPPVVREDALAAAAPDRVHYLFMPSTEPAAKRPPPWYVAMSSEFCKDVVKIDRKLQGRILEALVEIAEKPLEPKGDTVKPLTGALKGCWRYRIADHRLIYSPNQATGNITLLAFASRGSAYQN